MPPNFSPDPRAFPRPRVVISRCITFDPVRYNGSIIASGVVQRMKPFVDFIPVCPEVGIGLGVPRDPIRIIRTGTGDRLIQPATGRDLTEGMERFALEFLDGLPPVDGFILKHKSPSSAKTGAKMYLDAETSSPLRRGPGIFGRVVLARFGRFPIEDEGRLRNARVRDHFLTAIFTIARFREAKESGNIRNLARFHGENRLLLSAASWRALRLMERLVADPGGKALQEVFALYEDLLLSALRRPPRVVVNIRILTDAGGSFGDRLPKREKKSFQAALLRYRDGIITMGELRHLLLSWIARFGEPELSNQGVGELAMENQTFFSPYPEELNVPETYRKE